MEQILQIETTRNVPESEVPFEEFINWQDEDTHAELVGGRVRVKTPATNGFWLQIEWLWQQPPVWDVLKEWGLV